MVDALVSHKGILHRLSLNEGNARVEALKVAIEEKLLLEHAIQKLIFKGRTLSNDAPVPSEEQGKMMLLVSSQAAVAEMNQSARAAAEKIAARQNRQAGKINKTAASSTDTAFRFHRITCLTHLPNHERSLAYLHRLAEDRCIRKLMQQEKYTVGLLTEMDPRLHTSHDSKTLGLNKNAGQEILLRLRTDSLDGWRDYKGVRATLLHELTHNVHSEHDKHFFALLGKHSKDVQRWEAGHTLQQGEVFVPTESLLSSSGTQSETHQLGSTSPEEPTTDAREARARAAEFRANQAQRD